MKVEDFNYHLPQELIAQQPVQIRDRSRLMVLTGDKITHWMFSDLPGFLRPGDVMVFNDTKVIPARLHGKKEGTGGKLEVFLLKEIGQGEWEVLLKPGKRVRKGQVVLFEHNVTGKVSGYGTDGIRIMKFSYEGNFEDVIEQLGKMPYPPYIHEEIEDPSKYQTIYARSRGSVVAPTAGLHFTENLMDTIKRKGVDVCFVTLHVGIGTFKPVKCDRVEDHKMHSELCEILPDTAEKINKGMREGRRIIAVGTTTVRTLESAAIGEHEGVRSGQQWTDLFIKPGYDFRVIDGLITNFHLPKSSLLMMVSAFAGRERVLKAYHEAIKERYRFFSFGDGMAIFPE